MSANPLLLEAIALKKCILATYNRVEMLLAPHILYSKNGAFYVDAVALEKNGEPPQEKKLGAFHLAGLTGLSLVDRHFDIEPHYEPGAERYSGATLFAVE